MILPSRLSLSIVKIERFLLQGNVKKAAENCRIILRLLPNQPEVNTILGIIMLITGESKKAIPHFEKALTSNPRVISHWANLIAAVDKAGNEQNADELLEQAKLILTEAQHKQLIDSLFSLPHIQSRNMWKLYDSGHYREAEIAARLFNQNFPSRSDGHELLERLAHLQQPKSA